MNPDSVVFHIPHILTRIPPEYLGDFYENVLTENLRHMTDRYTDEFFDFGFGERIVFPVSRLVCDPERFREVVLGYIGKFYDRSHDRNQEGW